MATPGDGGVKLAVVLFNLGGPDRPESVQPFLFNLFSDPAILRVPGPLRWLLARLISRRRAPVASGIYARLGGGSPLLANTRAQASALAAALAELGEIRAVPAMRYWHPLSDETARALLDWMPDRIVLLPLYPQFSTTTTASSLLAWRAAAAAVGLRAPVSHLCCYPTEDGFIEALADLTAAACAEARAAGRPRILFSAHGLPEKVVAGGDPYQWQVERTAEAVMARLPAIEADPVVCYQSRVGPLKWIGPSTEEEIVRAGRDRAPVVVVPLAFVSEHSETLVELDIEYREKAAEAGVPAYVRAPTVSTHPAFIRGLAALVRRAVSASPGTTLCGRDERLCPASFGGCGRGATP